VAPAPILRRQRGVPRAHGRRLVYLPVDDGAARRTGRRRVEQPAARMPACEPTTRRGPWSAVQAARGRWTVRRTAPGRGSGPCHTRPSQALSRRRDDG
jgi:hypothetical protein